MMENMLLEAALFWQKVMLKICKVNIKKNPVESMVRGIFLMAESGKIKLYLTWILQFSAV
jgi:hypothetical protein